MLSSFREYCGTAGLSEPTGLCDPGWYCTQGAEYAQPQDNAQGGQCQPGTYCPAGSAEALECSPGMYCADPELAEPSGNCSAGFYCILSADTATPTDGVTGR